MMYGSSFVGVSSPSPSNCAFAAPRGVRCLKGAPFFDCAWTTKATHPDVSRANAPSSTTLTHLLFLCFLDELVQSDLKRGLHCKQGTRTVVRKRTGLPTHEQRKRTWIVRVGIVQQAHPATAARRKLIYWVKEMTVLQVTKRAEVLRHHDVRSFVSRIMVLLL